MSTVQIARIEKPARKVLILRGVAADDYFAFCEEVGCDVFDQAWAAFQNIAEALDEPMGLWLPDALISPGTSRYVIGVEVPPDYQGELPAGMDDVSLPATTYVVFHAQPGEAMFAEVRDAVGNFGDTLDHEVAPVFQYAPDDVRGYVEGHPVQRSKRDDDIGDW